MPKVEQSQNLKFVQGIEKAVNDCGFDSRTNTEIEQTGLRVDLELTPARINVDQVAKRLAKLSEILIKNAEQHHLTLEIFRPEDTNSADDNGKFQFNVLAVSDAYLNNMLINDKMDLLFNDIFQNIRGVLKKRNPKRNRNELPDSSKDHQAAVNRYPRPTVPLKVELPPELAQSLNERVKALGIRKRSFVIHAIEKHLFDTEPK